MRPAAGKIAAFTAACVLTAVAWRELLPVGGVLSREASTPSVVASPVRDIHWSAGQIQSALTTLEQATTGAVRLEAIRRLSEIPVADVPQALEMAKLEEDYALSLAAKVLLIRWASQDGEAAVNWAWQRFPTHQLWDAAFRQIGPAWAWHSPTGFGQWVMTRTDVLPDGGFRIHPAGDRVSLDFEYFSEIGSWLLRDQPRLAFQVLEKRGMRTDPDLEILRALKTGPEVRAALEVFDGLDHSDPRHSVCGMIRRTDLLQRWKEVDREEFDRSSETGGVQPDFIVGSEGWKMAGLEKWTDMPPDARIREASRIVDSADPELRSNYLVGVVIAWARIDPEACLTWIARLPATDRQAATTNYLKVTGSTDLDGALALSASLTPAAAQSALVAAFGSWAGAHPGSVPDQSSWTDGQRQAWQDLEVLRTAGRAGTGQGDLH